MTIADRIKAKEEASSFPDIRPPNAAIEMFRERTEQNVYIFYKDKDGCWWYETETGLRFKEEMKEREKKNKKMS